MAGKEDEMLTSNVLVKDLRSLAKNNKKGEALPVFSLWFAGARGFSRYSGVQELIIHEETGDFEIVFSNGRERHSLSLVQGIKMP